MATPARPVEEKAVDEAEKLLSENEVLIVPAVQREDGLLSVKSSKKVKLPEDEGPAVGGGRFTIGPAPERDWEMVPPDGKWGWCILVGATLVNILIPGTIKSFGVLLPEFNRMFQSSASASNGVAALCYFLYSSLGPLSSILSVKWSYRTVTLIGGSFAAFGMIFSTFAFSITYLYFSFGAMVGIGAGLAFPPTVYIVTSYFVRLRGLANGICMSGSAFGSIILPPVIRLLLETYGYNGAVLILGGVMLNVWAAALLFQPVEEHMVKQYKDREDDEDGPQLEPFAEEDVHDLDQSNPKLVLTSEDNSPTPTGDKYLNGSPPIFKNQSNAALDERSPNRLEFARSASAVMARNADEGRIRKISTPASSKHGLQHISSKSHWPSNPSLLESVPEGKTSRVNSQEAFGKKLLVPKTPKRSPSTSSFQYMSTPFHGSTLSAFEKPSEFTSQFSLKSVTDSLAPISYCCGCKKEDDAKKEPSKYFDVQLLKDPIYLVILISNCTCAISYTNFIILVPAYAQECGFDSTLGAYLLSIISALDLVGRIGGSALSDIVTTPKRYFFITGLLLSGISLALLPSVSSYLGVSAFCSVFGLASGINVGVCALVMTEMLGAERLMSSYGISLFMNGILQLIGPPICGAWYEYTNSYKSLIVTLGFILMMGASLWCFVPLIHRRRKRAENMKEVDVKA
ncbi:monocarboxylate transporter 12 isoform X1 [Epargyreus clarus]|uniref:monocarboxylate transporter 12 isoform X1 n=1 Tax=Epargyreus clarus TaxID=520877 RepID=UPI003C2CB1F3